MKKGVIIVIAAVLLLVILGIVKKNKQEGSPYTGNGNDVPSSKDITPPQNSNDVVEGMLSDSEKLQASASQSAEFGSTADLDTAVSNFGQ